MNALNPKRLVQRQQEIDAQRTARFPDLLKRKLLRMTASPLAYLRGAAPLFYELLQDNPEFAEGPAGEGWIVGDAHLENFGAYSKAPRAEGMQPRRRVATFDLNDFDDAAWGPWRWDVLRLTTSLILAGRELGISGVRVLELSEQLIQSYVAAAFTQAPVPSLPAPVATLVARVQSRTRVELLDARTVSDGTTRRFIRGERYRSLSAEVLERVPKAFQRYAERVSETERARPEQLEIVDVAHRIAGTGSLGVVRVAVLTRGKGGPDGGWIFDMKEQFTPSPRRLLGSSDMLPAESAATACKACVEFAPRMLATTKLDSLSMFVRRLTPQEDKLNLKQLKADDLLPLASYLGALLGAAHFRGSGRQTHTPWTPQQCSDLLERAVILAGIHEAIYLELCLYARRAR